MKFYKLGWIWQFIDIGEGTVKLGTHLDARAASIELALESTIGGTTTNVEEKVFGPLGTLGLALDINPSNWMNIFTRGSGLEIADLGYYVDTEAGIKLIPFRNLSISGGYRYSSLEVRDEGNNNFDSKVELRFKGPFAGASLRFWRKHCTSCLNCLSRLRFLKVKKLHRGAMESRGQDLCPRCDHRRGLPVCRFQVVLSGRGASYGSDL